jgi:N-acyl homoserine lactone hydrolase
MVRRKYANSHRVHRLQVGVCWADQGLMTYFHDYGVDLSDQPIQFFYIEGPGQNILVDAGAPAELTNKLWRGGQDLMSFEDALASVSLKPQDIDIIIATHLHFDHMGNAQKCRNAKVYVQEEELRFAYSPHPILAAPYSCSYLRDLKFVVYKGDLEIVPGVRALHAPGHTPGTQAVAVETKDGLAIMTGFCCNEINFTGCPEAHKDDWNNMIPIGIHSDIIKAWDSQLRIKGLADIIIPQHGREIPAVIG